jgi:hypothetical protein
MADSEEIICPLEGTIAPTSRSQPIHLKIFPPRSTVFSGLSFLRKKVFYQQKFIQSISIMTVYDTYLRIQDDPPAFIDP